MSLYTRDDDLDDPELPPPSAQQPSYVPAQHPRHNTQLPPSGVPRRDARNVSHKPTVATQHAARAQSPAVDHGTSSRALHNNHTPSASSTKLSPASQQHPAKPSSSAQSSAHPPPLLTSGVASTARTFFDPWNSSSTGHQRAENRLSGSTSWRQSRSLKLAEQYKGGLGGGKRVADTVGAGSEDFGKDGRLANGGWEKGAKGLRTGGQKSLAEIWGKSKASTAKRSSQEEKQHLDDDDALLDSLHATEELELPNEDPSAAQHLTQPPAKQIFRGLTFYINGSTMPLISDHKLKYVLHAHGASQSIALGRRTVTHVILGSTCGGGLAGSKIQKEIAKTRGNAVKYVSVEWVLESIKAETRLPESRFSPLKLAPKGQVSVLEAMRPAG